LALKQPVWSCNAKKTHRQRSALFVGLLCVLLPVPNPLLPNRCPLSQSFPDSLRQTQLLLFVLCSVGRALKSTGLLLVSPQPAGLSLTAAAALQSLTSTSLLVATWCPQD
jgi:hypothetical protein